MREISIVIPTRNRLEKLKRVLDSIPSLNYLHIIVVCDGDVNTYDFLVQHRKDVDSKLVPENKGAVYCRNLIAHHIQDGLLYATDDIVFMENSIQHAFEIFNKTFLDDDGVVGFVQEGNSFHPTGVGLVGQKFLQRYPSKQLFCPQYFHFACQEIHDLCQKVGGKFVQDSQAKVFHYHPCNYPKEMDQTHKDARKFKAKDFSVIEYRKKHNLTWGYNG